MWIENTSIFQVIYRFITFARITFTVIKLFRSAKFTCLIENLWNDVRIWNLFVQNLLLCSVTEVWSVFQLRKNFMHPLFFHFSFHHEHTHAHTHTSCSMSHSIVERVSLFVQFLSWIVYDTNSYKIIYGKEHLCVFVCSCNNCEHFEQTYYYNRIIITLIGLKHTTYNRKVYNKIRGYLRFSTYEDDHTSILLACARSYEY